MTLRDRLGQLNRLQHGRAFKIVATVVVMAAAVALGGAYWLGQRALDIQPLSLPEARTLPESEVSKLSPEEKAAYQRLLSQRRSEEAVVATFNSIKQARLDPTPVFVGLGAVAAVLAAVVWIGHGLTGLAVVAGVALLSGPMWLLGGSLAGERADLGRSLRDGARFVAAVGALGFSFVVLMELLRTALGGRTPALAIARNVVNEAVRMKVSLVFIVLLIFTLAALPGLLDASTPLRYRVQNFLQYGTGGAFWLIAVLTLLLAVGTVAFEQRDKIIWQTMTKPVSAAQYLFGKWLGVSGVAAVLLGVSAAGVFLFTEYLRGQPALREVAPYVAPEGEGMTEDRFVLETQVLAARRSVGPEIPRLSATDEEREIDERIRKARESEGELFVEAPNLRDLARQKMLEEQRAAYLTVEPGQREFYRFTGLADVKARGAVSVLRFKVESGANDPRELYRLSFRMVNAPPAVKEVPLGQAMVLTVAPESIDEKGVLEVEVTNGDMRRWSPDDKSWMNGLSLTFPPDGLELYYPEGSYRLNFARVVAVLWLKLAFLAMVAVAASTFLSFSVASLVAFGAFLVAESSGFLNTSLEYFSTTDTQNRAVAWKVVAYWIAQPVAWAFSFYSRLNPTGDLVDGRLVGWGTLARSVILFGGLTALLFLAAVTIFRRRELATYSGQ